MHNNVTINKSEYYSFGHIYRRWARLNKRFPLLVNGNHGILKGTILRKNFPPEFHYFISHNERISELAKENGFKVIKSAHPYVYFKKLQGINTTKSNLGGVYFLSHSIAQLTYDINFIEIIDKLIIIKNQLKKVTICIYYLDWDKWHLKFEEYGFETICLGVPMDDDFVYNLYDLLSKHSVVLDDSLGSHIFYGIDYGLKIWRFRESDNIEIVDINEKYDNDFEKILEQIFPVTDKPIITNEQIEFVKNELGYSYFIKNRIKFKIRLIWIHFSTIYRMLKGGFHN